MHSALTLALVVAAAEPIHVEERRPFFVVFLAPLGELSVIDASAVIAGLSLELKNKTDLEVVAVETERTGDCAGELNCLIERTGAEPPLFLVLSAVKAKTGDRVSATLVEVADRIVLLRPEWSDIATTDELNKWIVDLINTKMRPMFEKHHAWAPFGEIALEGLPNGAAIALDGITRGVSEDGSARLAGVKPGQRTISIEHELIETAVIEVSVARGETAIVTPNLISQGYGPKVRKALFWTGSSTAVIGSGLLVYALATSGESKVVCLTNDPISSACEGHVPFQRTGGIAMAPLGYSILAAGAVWALGSIFFGDEVETPWLAMALGTGVGLASFLASSALEPN